MNLQDQKKFKGVVYFLTNLIYHNLYTINLFSLLDYLSICYIVQLWEEYHGCILIAC
jgi:hypothetical protein